MRKLVLALAAAILALAIPVASAGHPPPATRLRSGDTTQKGLQSSYCWHTTCADYMSRWPKPKPVEQGSRASIKVAFAQKPTGFSILSFSDVDENGFPAGEEDILEYSWRRARRDGETVAWKAVFDLPDRIGHAYMRVFASWENQGDSSWTLHLKLS